MLIDPNILELLKIDFTATVLWSLLFVVPEDVIAVNNAKPPVLIPANPL